jgi:regulation of enolase protein 1 (concanavalin A-like superfamily)
VTPQIYGSGAEKILKHVSGHKDVWITTGGEIAEWYQTRYGYVLDQGRIVFEGTSAALRADTAVLSTYLGVG